VIPLSLSLLFPRLAHGLCIVLGYVLG